MSNDPLLPLSPPLKPVKPPRSRKRTTRGAVGTDPQTFTEGQVSSIVAAAIAEYIAEQQAQATREGVDQLKREFEHVQKRFDQVLDGVKVSNNIKKEILASVETMKKEVLEVHAKHLQEIEPIGLQNWSVDEKKALRPTVLDFLTRSAGRVLLSGKWRRRSAVFGAAIAFMTLALAAASSIYNAVHGVANPILPTK